jgi:hypothetical protein
MAAVGYAASSGILWSNFTHSSQDASSLALFACILIVWVILTVYNVTSDYGVITDAALLVVYHAYNLYQAHSPTQGSVFRALSTSPGDWYRAAESFIG